MNHEREATTRDEGAEPARRHRVGGEDPLGAALRALPAERAGAGFTARVMARFDDRGGASAAGLRGGLRRSPNPWPAAGWAALAAAVLAVVFGLALVRGSAPAPESRVAAVPPDDAPSAEPNPAAGSTGNPAPAPPAELPAIKPTGPAEAPASDTQEPPQFAAPVLGRSAVGSPATADVPAAVPGPGQTARPAAGLDFAPAPRRVPDAHPAAVPSVDARAALARVRAELDALRRDHRRLEVGLAELPEIGRHGQPVVFVGGDEGLGLVLDLGREGSAAVAEATDGGPTL